MDQDHQWEAVLRCKLNAYHKTGGAHYCLVRWCQTIGLNTHGAKKNCACLRRVSWRDSAAACRACQDSFQTQVDARVQRAAKPGSSEEDVAGAQPLSTAWTTCQLCLLEKRTSFHLRGYGYEWAMYIYVRQHNKSSMLYKCSWSSRGGSFTGKKF